MTDADGLILSKSELLVLLDAVGADDLIGVDSDSLVPETQDEHARLVREGIKQLKSRGLLEVVDDVNVINPELFTIAQIFAHPQLVTVVRKEVPEKGEQLFLYYQRELFIIEHTMPEQEAFRFATIPNTLAMINRIDFILPVQKETPDGEEGGTVPQEFYLGAQWLTQQGQVDEAATVLGEHGLSQDSARGFATALASHDFAAAIGLLRVEDGSSVSAKEMTVVQADNLAWLVLHEESGEETVLIRTTDAEGFRIQLFELLRDLLRRA